MIDSKHFNKIVMAVVAILVVLCIVAMCFSDALKAINKTTTTGKTMEYESALFDTSSIIQVEIDMDEDDWNDLLENAIDENYYPCDVTINGTTFEKVGIRAKGNTSLSNIASDDTTDRYSFKLEFGHYVDGQTCFGLDKLILNNNYADATNMKEAICYDMYEFLGADAPLYNYAKIDVNDEYWGVYLALESVEESFEMRNYGDTSGNLYKPESMGVGGRGNMKDADSDDNKQDAENGNVAQPDDQTKQGEKQQGNMQPGGQMQTPPDMPGNTDDSTQQGQMQTPPDVSGNTDDSTQQGQMPQMGQGKGDMNGPNGSGCVLDYVDDDLDSYDTIWEGEVDKTTKKDHKRLVESLKNISEENDIEDYVDVDNILKYMAVHTFVVNLDSLSGNMDHNYYIYENDGVVNIIPWDYNLAFGGYQSTNASDTINFAIDTPYASGISSEDRQFFAWIFDNEEYLEQYHEYLQMLCDEYVNNGQFETTYERIRSQIDELVESDPTAFYSYDEYDKAAQMLCEVVKLRTESVLGQLDGSIPSTNDGQEADNSSLIDASDINIQVMGTMGGGAGGGKDAMGKGTMDGGQIGDQKEMKSDEQANTQEDNGQQSETTL